MATTFVVAPHQDHCPMGEGAVFWDEGAGGGRRVVSARPSSTPSAPLFILYSSGSTAKPKGILHATGAT